MHVLKTMNSAVLSSITTLLCKCMGPSPASYVSSPLPLHADDGASDHAPQALANELQLAVASSLRLSINATSAQSKRRMPYPPGAKAGPPMQTCGLLGTPPSAHSTLQAKADKIHPLSGVVYVKSPSSGALFADSRTVTWPPRTARRITSAIYPRLSWFSLASGGMAVGINPLDVDDGKPTSSITAGPSVPVPGQVDAAIELLAMTSPRLSISQRWAHLQVLQLAIRFCVVSSMHRALLLPDIFSRILDFVEVEIPDTFYAAYCKGRWKNGSFARLARTCRTFLEPSLNALWKHQFTLAPLVKTLPEDAWDEVCTREPSPYNEPDTIFHFLTMKRPLTSSDWTRFDYYAGRIQSLGYLNYEFADGDGFWNWFMSNRTACERPVDWAIVDHLATYRRRRWLLPNLVRLRWTTHNQGYTDYLPLFLGPHLKTLAIACGPYNQWLEPSQYKPELLCSILRALPFSCPSLTGIEIEPHHDLEVVEAAGELSLAYDNLEIHSVTASMWGVMDVQYVDHLSKKPHLRKVWLGLNEDTVTSLQSLWAGNAYPFSSLSILAVDVTRLQVCTDFLSLLGRCRLFSLTVDVEFRPGATEIHSFFDTLHRCCARNTLHVCRIFQGEICELMPLSDDGLDPEDLPDPDRPVGMAELAPALHFPNLRYFILNVSAPGYFFDEDLMQMADAWPGMIALSLMGGFGSVLRSPATWKGIGYLTSHCPQLTEVNLAFDTTSDNVEEITSLPGFRPNHWMRFLDVLDSTLPDDAERFARSLFAIAPRIVRVSAAGWTEDPNGPTRVDPFIFCEHQEIIMCKLRKMYMSDVYNMDERGNRLPPVSSWKEQRLTFLMIAADDVVNYTNEWSAWSRHN
ncbi:hypothetical protein NUW54_g5212 [Trametes sanguinea]|uniref:Uncharacterized protein n=1 Tax=Trametes sanguinea TaxID=158606 RepID=A0ACC1PYS1_9APHY|nr:hypothetical protein NUW54_g5212 [Trametes sanguinea]